MDAIHQGTRICSEYQNQYCNQICTVRNGIRKKTPGSNIHRRRHGGREEWETQQPYGNRTLERVVTSKLNYSWKGPQSPEKQVLTHTR